MSGYLFSAFHWRRTAHRAHRGRRGEGGGLRKSRKAAEPVSAGGSPFVRGGGRFGGGGGGGGRIFGRGDQRLILLALIEEKPRHGYELIKELELKFGGGYTPSPGSIYPTLMLLEELEFVRATVSNTSKKLFEITAVGRGYLRENEAALKSALARMEMAARAVAGAVAPETLHHAMHTLKAALQFHRGGWNEKEVERVRRIIEGAAEAITRKPDRE
jgi:DNA-binding PadR family transcriptional regulator